MESEKSLESCISHCFASSNLLFDLKSPAMTSGEKQKRGWCTCLATSWPLISVGLRALSLTRWLERAHRLACFSVQWGKVTVFITNHKSACFAHQKAARGPALSPPSCLPGKRDSSCSQLMQWNAFAFYSRASGPECLLGSKQFSVSYSYFPMLRERPLMILAPGNKDCFLSSKKKEKAPYKIWTSSGKAMMFEVNIIQAFLKLRDLGYPPVALLRIDPV